jgi:hypothetical protein
MSDKPHYWRESLAVCDSATLFDANDRELAHVLRIGVSWAVYEAGKEKPSTLQPDKRSAMRMAELFAGNDEAS